MQQAILAGAVGGLLGVLAGAYLTSRVTPVAPGAAVAPAANARFAPVLSAERIELRDAGGRLRAELAVSQDGGPALFFFDSAGRNRLVLGLYSAAEGEAPSVVLNDAQQRAAGIFRLFGSHDAPVVVLKSEGRDRSVYGLNPGSAEPFLANYDGSGSKSDVFGRY